jgi:hypothetical protein
MKRLRGRREGSQTQGTILLEMRPSLQTSSKEDGKEGFLDLPYAEGYGAYARCFFKRVRVLNPRVLSQKAASVGTRRYGGVEVHERMTEDIERYPGT